MVFFTLRIITHIQYVLSTYRFRVIRIILININSEKTFAKKFAISLNVLISSFFCTKLTNNKSF